MHPSDAGHPWQVALVQSVAGRELEKVGHRGAHEMRMQRSAVTPAVDVGLHDFARGVNVVAIETGAMIFVFTDDLKATNRSAVSFSTAGYPGRRGSVLFPIEIGFLLPQAHDDRWPSGMRLRQVRRDHGRSRCRSRSRPRASRRAHKIVKVDSLLDQTKGMQNRSMVVNYQRRCRASR